MIFGEAVALVEAAMTISGTAGLVDGDHEARAVVRGAVHRAEPAMAPEVYITDHGALAKAVEAVHGAPVEAATTAAATAAMLLEEV